MNYFDIIFIILIAWSAWRGFSKGFVFQVITLTALVLGIYGAVKFSPVLCKFMSIKFHMTSEFLPLIAFAITFILIVIILHIVGRLIEKLIKAVALSFANKIAGVVFSIAKALFIISIILTGINHVNESAQLISKEKIEKSLLYEPISKIAPAIFPYLHFDKLKPEALPEEEIQEEPTEV
ncbi:MAG: CvpA family protein [Bacteroidales bacterium]|nr:CvpA family protein [Bacteroidales bacterium]